MRSAMRVIQVCGVVESVISRGALPGPGGSL
jgi:hypothetical protein